MNPPRSVAVASLFITLAGIASAAGDAPEPKAHVVISPSKPRETSKTARIAPSSSVHPSVAQMVAAKLGSLVPGSQIHSVSATGSMRPMFDDNSVLVTEPAPFEKLEVGDIVIFRPTSGGPNVVHRILERRDDGFWTRGDRSNRMDTELVTPQNYVGRVYAVLFMPRSESGPLPEALRNPEQTIPRPEPPRSTGSVKDEINSRTPSAATEDQAGS